MSAQNGRGGSGSAQQQQQQNQPVIIPDPAAVAASQVHRQRAPKYLCGGALGWVWLGDQEECWGSRAWEEDTISDRT
jgi:hypothetical protein